MSPLQNNFQGQIAKEAYLQNNTKEVFIYETIVDQQFITVWGNETIPGPI